MEKGHFLETGQSSLAIILFICILRIHTNNDVHIKCRKLENKALKGIEKRNLFPNPNGSFLETVSYALRKSMNAKYYYSIFLLFLFYKLLYRVPISILHILFCVKSLQNVVQL